MQPRPPYTFVSVFKPPNLTVSTRACSLVLSGVTVIAAAGNDNRAACASSPAAARFAITVAATDQQDERLLLRGGGGSNYGACVDLYAPGAEVPGASHLGDQLGTFRSGTSQVCHH